MNGSGNDEKKKLNLEETLILLFSEGREREESLLYWEGIFPMDEAKFLADLLPRMRHIKIQVRNLLQALLPEAPVLDYINSAGGGRRLINHSPPLYNGKALFL